MSEIIKEHDRIQMRIKLGNLYDAYIREVESENEIKVYASLTVAELIEDFLTWAQASIEITNWEG